MRKCCGITALDSFLGAETGSMGGFSNSSGVAAYDALAGATHGRVSDISMATMVELAMDNDTILYPMRVPTVCLLQIVPPYILLHQHHFTTIKRLEELPGDLGEHAFILHSEPMSDFIIDLVEARELRGGSFFSSIGDVFGDIGGGFSSGLSSVGSGLSSIGSAYTNAATDTGKLFYQGVQGIGNMYDDYGSKLAQNPYLTAGAQLGMGAFGGPAGIAAASGLGAYSARQRSAPGMNPGFGQYAMGAAGGALTGAGGASMGPSMGINYTGGAAGASGAYGGGMVPGQASTYTGAGATGMQAAGGAMGGAGAYGQGGFLSPGAAGKLGMGLLAGSAMIPTPTPPNFYPNPDEFRAMMARGPMTASGQAAAAEIQRTLGTDSTFATQLAAMSEPFAQAALSGIDRQYDYAEKMRSRELEAAGVRPESGLHQQSLSKLRADRMAQKRDALSQVAGSLGGQFLNYKQALVGMGISIEDEQLKEIMGMTGMTAQDAAMRYGANVADINSIRGVMSKVGEMAVGSWMGAYGKGGQGGGGVTINVGGAKNA